MTPAEQAAVVTAPGDTMPVVSPPGRDRLRRGTRRQAIHFILAFGVQAFTGRDFLRALIVQAVYDPVFRRDFPRAAEGEAALRERRQALGQQIRDACRLCRSGVRDPVRRIPANDAVRARSAARACRSKTFATSKGTEPKAMAMQTRT